MFNVLQSMLYLLLADLIFIGVLLLLLLPLAMYRRAEFAVM
jgi:hypothetical protein